MENAEVVDVSINDALPVLSLCEYGMRQGRRLEDDLIGKKIMALKVSGVMVFVWAVGRVGNEDWVVAAASPGVVGVDMAAVGFSLIDATSGANSVGFQTRRKGLVKKALKAGYVVDGYILRKSKC